MTGAPAFQLYARDWLSGTKCRMLSPASRAAYMDLLCIQWLDGQIPEGSDLETWLTRNGYDPAELDMERISTLFPSGRNERLEDEREKQAVFRKQKSDAGKKSARLKKKRRKSKPKHKVTESNTVATPLNGRSNGQVEVLQPSSASSSALTTDTDSSLRSESAEPPRSVTAQVLVGAWIDLQPERPSSQHVAKQAAVAKRICEQYADDAIQTAITGMGKLYPHSAGEPWDLFDLERKFPKAVQAAVAAPKQTPIEAFLESLPDGGSP